MQVLSDKNRVLYDKLVRLADGDPRIVNVVLSNPNRQRVHLSTVIEEIETLRDNPSDPRYPQPSISQLRKHPAP